MHGANIKISRNVKKKNERHLFKAFLQNWFGETKKTTVTLMQY